MRVEFQASFAAFCGLIFGSNALAQARCDCTNVIGSCSAEVSVQESFIEVTSNTAQCSRVDYFVDGTPFVALIVGGAETQERIAQSESPDVIVQSCQICLDDPVESDPLLFASGLYSDGEATRLIEVAPVFPPDAVAAGIEGFVEIRFTVSANGTVRDPEILSAEPEGVFEDAALAALDRWRYTGNLDGEAQTITERIEFDLADELFSLRPIAASAPRPVTAAEPLRNSCIQEESRYDFGSVIDVSLINACEEPLIVYSCSAGTGSYSERWVCLNPEQSGVALGSAATGTAGAIVESDSTDQFSTVARLEISRAPNSEYWWLACKVDDTTCHSDGRQWIRSIDRQTASIDPQNRTRVRLARSF